MPTDDESEDVDDTGIIQFATIMMRNERIYEEALNEVQRAYMDGIVETMMEYAVSERGHLPHHGAVGLTAWLNRCNLMSDEAVTMAMAFIGALEKWERERAGA